MDPDTCLARIRALVARQLAADEDTELAELCEALDEWISQGGFLPQAWRRDP
jgi:hypothetical protein